MAFYMHLIQILTGILVLALIYIMLRYLLLTSKDKIYFPEQWKYLLNKGQLSGAVIDLEKQYPDKVRFFNLWFQTERIKREQIPGSFAELGVYKGETAKILHFFDQSRRLLLFDTFDGFDEKDLSVETGEAAKCDTDTFSDTTVKSVLKYIDGNENVIVYKGYFPDTAMDIPTEKYALVTIDADLYNPVKAGLSYFYPLLSPGGVILVHDYTNNWEGVKRAVNEFVSEIPENVIEVPDIYGTVMIIKNKKI